MSDGIQDVKFQNPKKVKCESDKLKKAVKRELYYTLRTCPPFELSRKFEC